MNDIKIIFFYILFQLFVFTAAAQILSIDEVWLPLKYVEDIKLNKTLMNRKQFCDPIENIVLMGGELYFKTCLGRLTKANSRSIANNRFELRNVQVNINQKYFPGNVYKNHTFTVVRQTDTLLLLIKPPKMVAADTVKFIKPVPKKFASPINTVEGYLLLAGKYRLATKEMSGEQQTISFDRLGNIRSTNWKKYKLLAASLSLEDSTWENWWTFLIQLQNRNGNFENRILLYDGKRQFNLFKYTRNGQHKYVLDKASKITLTN